MLQYVVLRFPSFGFAEMTLLQDNREPKANTMNAMTKVILAASMAAMATVSMANTAVQPAPSAPHAAVHPAAVNQAALPKLVTVKQAQQLKDDTKVQLRGHVVKSLGDEKYEFRDSTGTIKIEVKDKVWHGLKVSPKSVVTLTGEVDVDHKPAKRVSIDVDSVKI